MTLRLFCLPYAGGSSTRIYRDLPPDLPPGVEVFPLELPGRGLRFNEPPLTDLEPVVADLTRTIRRHSEKPFAILGYSYGAFLGFEAALRLEADGGTGPRHLFVAAARAAICRPHLPPASVLPDHDFLERLKVMNGTPADLLENEALMEIMLPVIRADFTVADNYLYRPGPLLGAPITAFGGACDPSVTWPSVLAWRECTVARMVAHQVPGDHFFIFSARESFLSALTAELRRTVL